MTADIRTPAQREAAAMYPDKGGVSAVGYRVAVERGYELGAARVTPTREQIARKLAMTDDYDGCFERIDAWESLEQWERDAQPQDEPATDREDAEFWLRRADAVAELLQELAEGGSRCP